MHTQKKTPQYKPWKPWMLDIGSLGFVKACLIAVMMAGCGTAPQTLINDCGDVVIECTTDTECEELNPHIINPFEACN